MFDVDGAHASIRSRDPLSRVIDDGRSSPRSPSDLASIEQNAGDEVRGADTRSDPRGRDDGRVGRWTEDVAPSAWPSSEVPVGQGAAIFF